MSAPVPASTSAPPARQRGLDGLRGLAVIAVLLFHQGFGWARGGYLGVSLFFTLSGFLIARLLIGEVERTGGLGLRAFWGRRLRRLAPAALLALLLVCAYGALFATESQRLSLRGDLWASLANVTNWRFMSSGDSYADVFRDPSPVQHFWSLAIEEQFYLVFPLLVAGLATLVVKWRSAAHFRRTLGAVVIALMGVSLLEQFVFGSVDRIYYGTDTRAFELLAGVLLACCWTPAVAGSIERSRRAAIGGVAVFAVMVGLWSTVAFGTSWLFHGGLAGVGLLSVVVIVAAMTPGPVRSLGSWRPLVAVGLVSYGLYLYHWPVFLVFDSARTGLSGWALFALRCTVTAVLAIASYHLLELPFRKGAAGRLRAAPVIWIAALLAAAVVVPVAVPRGDRGSVIDSATFAHAEDLIAAQRAHEATPVTPANASPGTGTAVKPTKVYVVGDSNGVLFAGGLALYAERTGAVDVRSAAIMRCPMGDIDRFNWNSPYGVFAVDVNPDCADARQRWAADLVSWRPDVIVVVSGSADAAPFHLRGTPTDAFLRDTEPAGRDALVRGVVSASTRLLELAPGVPQIWLTSPYVNRGGWADGTLRDPDGPQVPVYTDVYNEVIGELTTNPLVKTVPWADAFNAEPIDVDKQERPDGVHTTPERISSLLDDWFPQIEATRAAIAAAVVS